MLHIVQVKLQLAGRFRSTSCELLKDLFRRNLPWLHADFEEILLWQESRHQSRLNTWLCFQAYIPVAVNQGRQENTESDQWISLHLTRVSVLGFFGKIDSFASFLIGFWIFCVVKQPKTALN